MVPLDYVAPTDPQHTAAYEFAKKTRLLEHASAFFTPFKLPKPLALKTRECAGDINAYYENDVHARSATNICDISTNSPKPARAPPN